MNRRGFLSRLFTGTVAAIAAPQIITHGLGLKRATTAEVIQYAVVPPEHCAVLNPDWVNAPYEIKWMMDSKAFKVLNGVIVRKGTNLVDDHNFVDEAYPIRFNTTEDYNAGKVIPPFILQPMRNA